jgi:hypothetical protein
MKPVYATVSPSWVLARCSGAAALGLRRVLP